MSLVAPALHALTAALIGASALSARADLQWEHTSVEQVAAVGRDAVEVAFRFSNLDKLPVTIVSLQPSCGCTTTRLEKTTYAPGEKGVLTAIFDGRGLQGVQEKTIRVISDGSPTPTTLTLRVSFPSWVEASPRLVWWPVASPGEAKEVRLAIAPSTQAIITSVAPENANFTTLLQPDGDPFHYQLIVRPLSTATALFSMVTLHLEAPEAAPRNYAIYVQVR